MYTLWWVVFVFVWATKVLPDLKSSGWFSRSSRVLLFGTCWTVACQTSVAGFPRQEY